MFCGTDRRHVGYSAFRVHPCGWQVHGISVTNNNLFQRGVLSVWRDVVFFLCRR